MRITTNDFFILLSVQIKRDRASFDFIVGLVLKCTALGCVLQYLEEHVGGFQHEVPDVGIQGVFSVWVGHYEDQAADYHCEVYGGGVVLANQRQADSSFVVDVGVVDTIETFEFGGVNGVSIRKRELEAHLAVFIWRWLIGSDFHIDDLDRILVGEYQLDKIDLFLLIGHDIFL